MSVTASSVVDLADSNHSSVKPFFDEMKDTDGQVRAHYLAFSEWLKQQDDTDMSLLQSKAHQYFIDKDILFNFSDGQPQIMPFDLIPRMIKANEWHILETGSIQRVKALNTFLHDVYHQGEILAAGIIPEQQVLGHECYQPWMLNFDTPNQVYSQISGVDIIRHSDGQYYVLEDNLRTPSGASYMLEARALSEQLCGDIFQQQSVLPIDHYPQLLKQTLIESSDVDQPVVVLLTPGRFNSAYFEHATLAEQMQLPLVTNHDLVVENQKVFVKTVKGKVQVDVIYRRIDDGFLDPLAFRPDSVLGVAGLMAAYRKGNVVIANAPGTGVADDKSIYPYVDKMIEFYLGEKPILHNVSTWRGRDKQDLDYILSHLSELVVKEAQGFGGYGMLIGPQASTAELAHFRMRLKRHPEAYIAQPTLGLSTCPILAEQGIAARHVDFRPFVLCSGTKTRVVAGGLTRVAMQEGSLVVNSSQGGGVKDTWVIQA